MAILRYTASADNTITNAFKSFATNNIRATGSNMGSADILEVFSIYGRRSSSLGFSTELSRFLIQFPISQIAADRNSGKIAASGSVVFNLKLYNAKHPFSLPHSYTIDAHPVSAKWTEGIGLDMAGYNDNTENIIGSNWTKASSSTSWATPGGAFHASPKSSQTFTQGTENFCVDVSETVEQWIKGDKTNYGFLVKLSTTDEGYFSSSTGQNTGSILHNTDGARGSRYTKKFFARSTEFFFKRPVLEALFDSKRKDDRGNFCISSSLLTAQQKLNRLYFYNYYNGKLVDIAGKAHFLPTASFFYASGSTPEGSARTFINSSNNSVTVLKSTRESRGIYYVDVAAPTAMITTTYPYLYDVWTLGGTQIFTGSQITPKVYKPSITATRPKYVISMPELLSEYKTDSTIRLRLYAREKGWSPNIYSVAKNKPQTYIIPSASFRILRTIDDYEVVSHDKNATSLSYDVSGNYFDLHTDILEAGYQYSIKYAIYDGHTNEFEEQPYEFKFRIVK